MMTVQGRVHTVGEDTRYGSVTEEPRPIIGSWFKMSERAVSVRQERCAKVRNRNVECLKCAAACTSGCITFEDGQLVVEASKCVGCGTCATVCPTCALEASNPNDAQLLGACRCVKKGEDVVIACGLALEATKGLVNAEAVARVVCAGRIEESLIAELVCEGVRRVHIVCGDCTKCAQRHGRATADLVAASARELLGAWGSRASVSVLDEFPHSVLMAEASSTEARRAMARFFETERACAPIDPEGRTTYEALDGRAASKGEDVAEKAGAPASGEEVEPYFASTRNHRPKSETPANRSIHRVMADGTLPHFLPDRRENLLSALASIGEPVVDRINSRLWGWVVINGLKCESCQMCATFCPTGALRKFFDDDGTFGVKHYPGDCVKCRSCENICPAEAITILDDVRPSYLLEGEVHRYEMRPRAAVLGSAQQILEHMRLQIDAPNIYER